MSDSFDPYYKWLAIPPDEQPPNHYRLLAVPLYTDDADVISHAADQRMSHIRSFQVGNHAAESHRILNELANARLCLLNPNEKSNYDAALKHNTAPPAPIAIPLAQPLPPPPDSPVAAPPVVAEDQEQRSTSRKKKRKAPGVGEAVKIIAGSVAGLAIGYLILCMIGPQYDFLGLMARATDQPDGIVANEPDQSGDGEVQEPTAPTPDPFAYTDEPKAVDTDSGDSSANDGPAEQEPPAEEPSEPTPTEPTETKDERLARLAAERDEVLEQGDLAAALSKVIEIAELTEADALETQAEFLLALPDTVDDVQRMRASSFLGIIEAAITTDELAFAKKHQDNLLRLARESGDPDLVRRATRIVLKIQSAKTDE